MMYANCLWKLAPSTLPVTAQWCVVVTNSGFACNSYWNGSMFDRTNIVFWTPTPTVAGTSNLPPTN